MELEAGVKIQLGGRRGPVTGFALVSMCDARFGQYNWCDNGDGYAVRRVGGRLTYLHREVLGLAPGDGFEGEHRNGVRSDCRRGNLLVVTHAENGQNKPSHLGSSSVYRGVTWDRARGKWMAHGTLNGHATTIGRFDSETVAAEAALAWRLASLPYTNERRAA